MKIDFLKKIYMASASKLLTMVGRKTIVSGLDCDIFRRSFGLFLDIFPAVDSVTKSLARCNLYLEESI